MAFVVLGAAVLARPLERWILLLIPPVLCRRLEMTH